jgi:hypothetical protein
MIPDMQSQSLTLLRLRSEVQAYLSRSAKELREQGLPAAPYAVMDFAKFLSWNADAFDATPALLPHIHVSIGPTIRELSADILAAVLPLCTRATGPKNVVATHLARVSALESEIATLRNVLNNRKGSPV